MKTSGPRARPGFTLIEVAFVVVVGLTIMTGVFVAYQANKEEAAGAIARKRVQAAQTTIEAIAAGNGGSFPESGTGQFSTTWARSHPEECGVSPWGGLPGDPTLGACEDAPFTDGAVDPASAPDKTGAHGLDGARQSNMAYVSIEGNRHVQVITRHTGDAKVYKGYIISIYDSRGNPWFDAVGAAK